MRTYLALAIGSIVWTLLQFVYPKGISHVRLGDKPLPFAHLAAGLAISILGLLAVVNITWDLMQITHKPIVQLGWYALAATAAAVVLCLWDRSARLPLLGLYVLALIAMSMTWDYRGESPRMICWRMGSEPAGFVLVVAIVGWLLPKIREICRWLWIPDDEDSDVCVDKNGTVLAHRGSCSCRA